MSRLHNLEDMDLHHNHLETIEPGALNSLTSLHSLNLASNRLHKCSASHRGVFDGMRSLRRLSFANNNLDGEAVLCYLSNVTSLVHLDLSRNAIVFLFPGMFDGIPRLSELDLSNNFIDEIQSGTFDSLKDLRVLNLAENAIRCISSFDLHQLHSLNLSSNIIEFFLTKEAGEHHQLISLDLSRNNLRHFPVLTGFQMVQHVNLSGNDIADLVPLSNATEEDDGEGWSWYEAAADLDLPTAIENSFSRLSNVRHLDLSSNQLAAFPWSYLSKMRKLSHLLLSGNCLQNLMATKVSETIKGLDVTLQLLKVIDLQANSIHFIPKWIFNFLPEIEHINLKSNKIGFCSSHAIRKKRPAINQQGCSTFSGAPNLHYLNLQKNNITHLPPRVFDRTPLVSLDLSHNPTLEIQETALDELSQSLQVLSVDSNGMEDSQMNLPCLQSLRSLEASNNQLTRVPSGLKCSSIESLDLRNNSLKTLNEATASQWKDSLRYVSISGNPLDCCWLAWLDLLLAAKVDVRDLEKAHCVYAKSERSVPINDTRHDYRCTRPMDDGYLKIAVIVLSGSFTLISVICYVHKRRDRKLCMACRTRSSKVAPETPAPAKGFNADGKQVCFTISRNELD
ncbi:transforming growth factor beta activator LRRC32-like [Aquarana catesbeiana]|uniref:transforming growth factor beta activator LRRC32-like n=1 Tax=Aquarana catesbeiana TaxID=8400 RepID=UPI003CCA4084